MKFGKAIYALRRKRGQTIKETAAKAGVSMSCISDAEANSTWPTSYTLKGITRALGITETYLVLLALDDREVSEENKQRFHDHLTELRAIMEEQMKGGAL